jgi:hypothetical protein
MASSVGEALGAMAASRRQRMRLPHNFAVLIRGNSGKQLPQWPVVCILGR